MARVESYSQFGGIHHETAALTNVLVAQGVKVNTMNYDGETA